MTRRSNRYPVSARGVGRWHPTGALAVLLAGALVFAACSSSEGSASTSTTSTSASSSATFDTDGIVDGYAAQIDETSPLVISAVGPDPIPVTGTDKKVHMVYELEVLNFAPGAATLTKLETLAGGDEGAVVASVEGEALTERTILVMDSDLNPIAEIPPGRTALILVDDIYEAKEDVPATSTPKLTATLGPAAPGYEGMAALFAEGSVTQFGRPIATSAARPVVIGPPLAGGDWLAANACCSLSSHRGTIIPAGGRINPAERYAIDWFQVDLSPDAQPIPGGVVPSHRGDPTKNEDYLAYGKPLLAVADGTVVKVVADQPDAPPGMKLPGLTLDELGGNVVSIDIGGGVFAFYAHLAPGSPTVKVGDKVTRGQVIGVLGNSGNTSEAHLHFQLSTSAATLTGGNVPFEIDTLTLVGTFDGPTFGAGPDAGARANQLPLIASLTSFPELR